jgi:3-(3-hydroxy-phenyl)propionate hydroxylase
MSPDTRPVVVAGAGPAGLFAAIMLVRAGHRVLVLEKNDGLTMDMRASTFHPATLDLLDPLGLADPLVFRGSITQGWQYMIHDTKQHAVFDLECIRDSTGFPFRLQCEQFHFSNIAVEYLVSSPLFEIRFAHEISEVENLEGGVLIKALRPGGEYEISTPWLIAADGAHSTVRRLLGLAFEGHPLSIASVSLVLDHPFQHDIPGIIGVNYVWTGTGYYSLKQIRDLWRFSYAPLPDQPVEQALSDEAIQVHLQSVFPSTEPYEILERNYYKLEQRCLESFRCGHVLFIGDAAHLDSPAGGFGMNAGIHDAQCLAEHLVPVLGGEDDRLLDRYSRRRRTVVIEEIQRLAARNDRWRCETDPGQRAVIWKGLQDIVNDPRKSREYLLHSSMIRSRQRELEID